MIGGCIGSRHRVLRVELGVVGEVEYMCGLTGTCTDWRVLVQFVAKADRPVLPGQVRTQGTWDLPPPHGPRSTIVLEAGKPSRRYVLLGMQKRPVHIVGPRKWAHPKA